jgi:hypothetical protein
MSTIQGCTKCGKSDDGMPIIMHRGNPLCEDCYTVENPPPAILCFLCKSPVESPVELAKKQPRCEQCAAKAAKTVEELKAHMDSYKANRISNLIEVRTDIFNADTLAIVDLKAKIDNDPNIANKAYELARILKEDYEHTVARVFELNEQLQVAGNKQKAIQTYLNNLANQLRAEEREKLRIADINYKPNPITPKVSKISTTGTKSASKKKASKKEISEAAKTLGIAEFTLHAFVLQSGGDLEVAVNKIKASIEAAKS